MKSRKTSEIGTDSTANTVRWKIRDETSKLTNGLKAKYIFRFFVLLTHNTELRSVHMLTFLFFNLLHKHGK